MLGAVACGTQADPRARRGIERADRPRRAAGRPPCALVDVGAAPGPVRCRVRERRVEPPLDRLPLALRERQLQGGACRLEGIARTQREEPLHDPGVALQELQAVGDDAAFRLEQHRPTQDR